MRWLPVVSLVLLAGGVSFAQQSGGTIEGQVVDAATGAPVRKAIVGLWHDVAPPKNDYSQVEADSLGRFVFSGLELADGKKMSGSTSV